MVLKMEESAAAEKYKFSTSKEEELPQKDEPQGKEKPLQHLKYRHAALILALILPILTIGIGARKTRATRAYRPVPWKKINRDHRRGGRPSSNKGNAEKDDDPWEWA